MPPRRAGGQPLHPIYPLTSRWALASCLLVGWDVAVGVYLVLALEVMATSDVQTIRRHAALQDDGQLALLVLTVASALASLAAIVVELGTGEGRRLPGHLAGAVLTILLSWAFIHTMFALHYAHEFYDEESGGGMAFPGGDPEPDYWDFAYFALRSETWRASLSAAWPSRPGSPAPARAWESAASTTGSPGAHRPQASRSSSTSTPSPILGPLRP
jgi:hypothetical protein